MPVTNPLAADTDGDGMDDGAERDNGTDPNSGDTDGDSIPDTADNCPFAANPGQEDSYGDARGDACEDNDDLDGDGLSNNDEMELGTDASNPDTDGDTFDDGDEVNASTDPLDPAGHP
jgi:hypothetical protein